MNINKVKISTYFFCFLLSLIIFKLSENYTLWVSVWGGLSIPPNNLPFSDFEAHLLFMKCHKNNINIFTEVCSLIPVGNSQRTTHPIIWVYIFDLLNFENKINYNIFIIITYFLYFLSLSKLFFNFKETKVKIFFLIFFLSTTNFILLERYSSDLIIFLIIYTLTLIKNDKIKLIFIFIGTSLKYYPVFLLAIFVENKKKIFSYIIIFIIFFIFFYKDQIEMLNQNMVEMAYFTAYGSKTMTRAFYFFSKEYNLFINDKNYNFFKNLFITLLICYCIGLLFITYIKTQKQKIIKNLNENEYYFLIGSSIYVGSYIFGSNVDYRLIYLIFTIPHLVQNLDKFWKLVIAISYIISINSFIFQTGNPLSVLFLTKGAFIFSCKFLILNYLIISSTIILKKINFFAKLKANVQKS